MAKFIPITQTLAVRFADSAEMWNKTNFQYSVVKVSTAAWEIHRVS